MILNLARVGLIHGDFNEFNILIKEEEVKGEPDADAEPADTEDSTQPSETTAEPTSAPTETTFEPPAPPQASETVPTSSPTKTILTPILIDFPQTLSLSHQNAQFYFNRDISCVKTFFLPPLPLHLRRGRTLLH